MVQASNTFIKYNSYYFNNSIDKKLVKEERTLD